MAGEKILIVDDEAVVKEILTHYLKKENFKVTAAGGGISALDSIGAERPDLIILDILLPDLDGLEICREIRRKTDVPIIFVTSKTDSLDLALGLGIGGDDYIKKPFNPIEVVARVKAHLRRYRQMKADRGPGQVIEHPGLKIDPASRSVEVNGVPVVLTMKEFDILALLAGNPDRFFSTGQLLDIVWNTGESADQRSLMVHMSKLRKKIEEDPARPSRIITVRGVGYKFKPA